MESQYPFGKYRFLLCVGTQFVLNFLLDFLHRLGWPKLLYHFFKRSEFFIRAYFWHDYSIILCLARVPADDDNFLHVDDVTWSLHLMIWMCLNAK